MKTPFLMSELVAPMLNTLRCKRGLDPAPLAAGGSCSPWVEKETLPPPYEEWDEVMTRGAGVPPLEVEEVEEEEDEVEVEEEEEDDDDVGCRGVFEDWVDVEANLVATGFEAYWSLSFMNFPSS